MEVDAIGARSRPSLEGRVFYTHGAGIDHPLSIGRLDSSPTVIIPEYDYRGNAISGYCTSGTLCTELEWPEKLQSPWDQDPPPSDPLYGGPAAWAGNLIDTHKDGSGYVYMRNRYYDPGSGRFTQVDPIGLAGGLNAYGFAGGDPVNYSDPFGLCLEDLCIGEFLAVVELGEEVYSGFKVLQTLFNATNATSAANDVTTLSKRSRTVANGGRASAGTKREVDEDNRAAHGGEETCVECGKKVSGGAGKDKKNYGHNPVPFSKGGGGGKDNIQIECAECNLRKGNRTESSSSPNP